MKNRSGFTLIELIIVVAIIGILGAIVVPGISAGYHWVTGTPTAEQTSSSQGSQSQEAFRK